MLPPDDSWSVPAAGRHRGPEAERQPRSFKQVLKDNSREPLSLAVGLLAGAVGTWQLITSGGFHIALGILVALGTVLLLVSYVASFTRLLDDQRWRRTRLRRVARVVVLHFWWVLGLTMLATGFLWAV